MEKIDLWQYEREAWAEGYAAVCGCDEAGAGPLAGPVYAAAVILSQGVELDGLNDSKKLTPKKRDILFDAIREQASAWAVAWVDAGEIDETDILSARMKAMQLAIDRLAKAADFALIDGNRDKGKRAAITTPHRTIVQGDGRSASIAAASILAKVSRERVQMELTKLLCSDHPEQIRQVYETEISRYVSEEFSCLPWEKAEISPALPKEKYVRWAAFLRCACPTEQDSWQTDLSCEKAAGKNFCEEREKAVRAGGKILRDLKLDNETIGRVKTLTSWCGEKLLPEAPSVRRAMSKMEPEVWDALVELNQYGDEILCLTKEIRAAGDCLDLKHLAVNGRDLMSAGVRPGKDMGEILNKMLQEVLERPENNQKEILMSMFVK